MNYKIYLNFIFFSITLSVFSQIQDVEIHRISFENEKVISTPISENEELIPNANKDSIRIFFAGEKHYQEKSIELEYELLKRLNQSNNVTNLIVELPISIGLMLQDYLNSGNEELLKTYRIDPLYGNLFKKIYAINKTLSNEKKIKVYGVELERIPEWTIFYFNSIIKNKKFPIEINKSLSFIIKLKNEFVSKKKINKLLTLFKKDMLNHKNIYEDFLNDDKLNFLKLIKGLEAWASKEYSKVSEVRENFMYENLLELINSTSSNFFAQFGTLHVSLNKVTKYNIADENYTCIASRLNSNNKLTNKVKSILYGYLFLETQYPLISKELHNSLRAKYTNKYNLISTSEESSPFQDLKDFYHYILLIN